MCGQCVVSVVSVWSVCGQCVCVLQALFNLAFMLEEGAAIPPSVWTSLHIPHHRDRAGLLMALYER